MAEPDLQALGRDAIGLLDTLAVERLTTRYRKENLEVDCGEAAR